MTGKLSKREIWALKTMLDFHIARYLMANTFGREDGSEKASEHIKISEILCQFIFAEGGSHTFSVNVNNSTMAVHDYLAEILTDRMDEVIDFPINKPIVGSEYDVFRNAFFDVIIKNFIKIENVAKNAVSES